MKILNTSVIIPTLNRVKDLEKTLSSISECDKLPFEVIIIDQSDNQETKDLCKNFKTLNIKYFHFDIKSSSLARNLWIDDLDENCDLVVFLDDDVVLDSDFFKSLNKFFEKHKSAKWWVTNIESPSRNISLAKRIWLFILSWKFCKDKTYVTSWWFNVMPLKNPNYIENIERTSGCWMFFRKEVFDEWFRFEKNFMKYSLMEDCFLSYWIQKKYPNSLFFVPDVKLTHCESPASRIANKQRIFQNIIHRYYFIKKFNKSYPAYLRTMFIFSIFDFMQYKTFNVFKYYIEWLKYVKKNKDNIWNSDFDFNEFIFW